MVKKMKRFLGFIMAFLMSFGVINGLQVTQAFAAGNGNVAQTAKGANHSLMLKEDGTVWSCGSNKYGQLGDGTTVDKITPVQVSGLAGVTAIAAGGNNSLAIKDDNTIWIWGQNDKGQLRDGTTKDKTVPVQINVSADTNRTFGAYEHNRSLKKDNIIQAQGYNADGTVTAGITPNQTRELSAAMAISSASTVTGKVSPVVYNDLGYGLDFLRSYDILVELRHLNDLSTTVLQTIVKPDGNSGTGTFTFKDVPVGDYALLIYRPGYLLRTMEVSISEDTLILQPSNGEESFSLIPGNVTASGIIEVDDIMWLNESLGKGWEELGDRLPLYDLDGNGKVEVKDVDITREYINYWVADYPDSLSYDQLETMLVNGSMHLARPKAPSVTGKVSPVVYDDLGLGRVFLSSYDVLVELRRLDDLSTTFLQTVVRPDGTSGIGTFTFRNVPVGDYALLIYRPGYLLRSMEVHITEDTSTLRPSNGEEIFDLCPGATRCYAMIEVDDLMWIIECLNNTWEELEDRLPLFDLDGNGIVEVDDTGIALERLNYTALDYPDALNFDQLMLIMDSYHGFCLIRNLPQPQNVKSIKVKHNSVSLTWEYVPGATKYDVLYGDSIIATTDSTGITIDKLVPETDYQFKVRAKNYFSTGEWSDAVTVMTEPPAPELNFPLDTIKGKDYMLVFTGKEIESFEGKIFKVTYDPAMLTLVDFAAQTKALDTAVGILPDTNITILSNANGVITFKVDKIVPAEKAWTGVLTAVKFNAKDSCNTVVKFE